jgi:integron integrase
MKSVPLEIMSRFQNTLNESISLNNHHYYKKWLTYYWDFCHKYHHPVMEPESLFPFLKELKEKKQEEYKVKQASDAVSIFYDNFKEKQSIKGLHEESSQEFAMTDDQNRIPSIKNVIIRENVSNYCEPAISKSDHSVKSKSKEITCKDQNVCSQQNEQNSSTRTGTNWKPAFEKLRNEIMVRHYSPKTLKSYSMWLSRFQAFTKSKQLESISIDDYKDFLASLAVEKNVAASTQNQAFNALLFFFRHVLKKEPGEIKGVSRAKEKKYDPVVLSRNEVDRVIVNLCSPYDLIVKLLYGSGLRLFECLNLRLTDFDIDGNMLTVHDGKGRKDRTVPLPVSVVPDIEKQFDRVSDIYENDLKNGYDGVFLLGELEKKYKNAAKELAWQWFFPAFSLTTVQETGEKKRYHLHERHVQRGIKDAVQKARLFKRVTSHTFRHYVESFYMGSEVLKYTV